MLVTADELRRVDAEWRAMAASEKGKGQARKALIRRALQGVDEQGRPWTHARVAEVLGLSRGRIGQF